MLLTFYSEWVGAIATCVGSLGTIIALIFLYHQIKGLNRTIENAESSAYLNMLQLMVTIDRFFIDEPELKPYFYNDKEMDAKEPVERDRLYSVAEMMTDFFEAVYYQRNSLRPETVDAYERYMRRIYAHSPVLRAFLREWEREQMYPAQFVRAFKTDDEAACKEMSK